ncbi:DUF4760 domain-containing protein [Vibrio parahaemolyticus]|nr:DUF4760 domain-containing protein [Vibrio parahaemolyticus]
MLEILSDILDNHPTVYSTLSAAILAAIFAWLALRHNIHASRTKNSIDFESNYKHNEKIVESSLEIKRMVNTYYSHQLAELALEKNFLHEDTKHINTILNEWERCANGVFHKIYDNNFLFGTYASTVLYLYKNLYPFIEQRRKHNPRVYTKFCWMAIQWQVRRQKDETGTTDKDLKAALKLLENYHNTLSK